MDASCAGVSSNVFKWALNNFHVFSRVAMTQQSKHLYEFGPYRIDPAKRVLLRGEESVQLPSKVFETLLVLVQHSEEVVSKDDLLKTVWPDSFVEESNLSQSIFLLRKALGETAQDHRYIVTIPGRGYRFADKVEEISEETGDLVVESHSQSRVTIEDENLPVRVPLNAVGRSVRLFALFAGLAILVAVGYLSWRHFRSSARNTRGRIMLAVLPFQNLTGDPGQEYISDGLTEEMITHLGGVHPERLGVIARTSVMGYKHGSKSVDKIGRELGVQYVLEGSLRQAAGRFRITAQLIQVSDQSHLWAEDYDRSPSDMLNVEAEVARAVADEIRLRLTPLERTSVARSKTVNPEAYDLYLQGRYALNKRTIEGFQRAQTFFRRAIATDPTYAPAYSGLAESQIVLASYGISAEASVLEAGSEAKKALAIDETLAQPHAILALIAQNHDWNWDQAEHEYRLAIASDPNYATAHHWYGLGLAVRGKFEDSFREIEIAQHLDPFSVAIRSQLGENLYFARRYDEALNKLSEALEMEPNFAPARAVRGLVYEQKGMWKEALSDLETARQLDNSPRTVSFLAEAYALAGNKERGRELLGELQNRAKHEYVSSLYPALIFAGLGDRDEAFSGLEKACQERTPDLIGLNAAIYDPLRSDPRFQDLMRRVGLIPK